jgi:hypothetical protein
VLGNGGFHAGFKGTIASLPLYFDYIIFLRKSQGFCSKVVSFLLKGGPRAGRYPPHLQDKTLALSFMTVAEQ